MHAPALVVSLITLGLATPLQDKPVLSEKTATSTTEDPQSTVQRLAEQTKRLHSFTATYRSVSKGSESVLHLAYRAPGRARFRVVFEEGSLENWILDGRLVMRRDLPKDAFTADIDVAAEFERDEGFGKALKAEFPWEGDDSDWLIAGPAFQIRPDVTHKNEKSFSMQLNWMSVRDHFLLWYGRRGDWANAKLEDGRLVRETKDGTRVALSTSNGFIDEITRPDGSHLNLIEFSESADDSEFEVPKPKEGMRDGTAELDAALTLRMVDLRRLLVYQRMSYEKDTSTDAFKSRLSRVFDALFTPALATHYTQLIEQMRPELDQFAQWCRDRYKQTADNPAAREELEKTIAARRTYYEDGFAQALDQQMDSAHPLEEIGLPPALVAQVGAVEQETYVAVAKREVMFRILAKFDEGIAAAKAGK